jgi:hypothetical protein
MRADRGENERQIVSYRGNFPLPIHRFGTENQRQALDIARLPVAAH